MSQKKYCPKCGKANEYIDGVAPKVCKSCKAEFAAAFKVELPPVNPTARVPKKKTIARKIEIEAAEEGDDSDDSYYLDDDHPEIIVPRKFEYDLNLPKRITIRDVANGENIAGGVNPNLGSSNIE